MILAIVSHARSDKDVSPEASTDRTVRSQDRRLRTFAAFPAANSSGRDPVPVVLWRSYCTARL